MPIGLAILGWTNKEGFFIIHKYPEFELNEEDAMQIGSTHRMRNLKANTITLNLKDYNVASFFTGTYTQNYYIVQNIVISLILSKDEDPQNFIKVLPLAVKDILNGLTGINLIDYSDRTVNIERVLATIAESEGYKEAMPRVFGALSFGTIQENEEELLSIIPPEEKEEVDLESLQMDLDGKQQGLELAQQAIENLKMEVSGLKDEIDRLEIEKQQQQQYINNIKQYTSDLNSKMIELKSLISTAFEEFKLSFLDNVNDKKTNLLLKARLTNFSRQLDELMKIKAYQILFIGNPEVGKKSILRLLSDTEEIDVVNQEFKLLYGINAVGTACTFEDISTDDDLIPFDLILLVSDSKLRDVMACGNFYKQIQHLDKPFGLIANKQDEPGATKITAMQQIIDIPKCPTVAISDEEKFNLSDFISKLLL
ncbi:MAG: hypothetical protein ACTSVE_01555 [Candidatus Helarchaeota archaeon]